MCMFLKLISDYVMMNEQQQGFLVMEYYIVGLNE